MRRGLLGAAVLAMVATLAGCDSGGDGTSPSAGAGDVSPLQPYLGGMGTGTDAGNGADPAKDRQVQELVVSCMKQAGFTYRPVDTSKLPAVQQVVQGDRNWTEKYGYGISTTDQVQAAPEDDPNKDITDKMSPAELTAYREALYGTGGATLTVGGGGVAVAGASPDGASSAPGSGAPTSSPPAKPGCYQTAREQVYGKAPQIDMSEFESLFKALSKLNQRIDGDPRVAPLVTAWSGCMADAGYPGLKAVNDAQDGIFRKWAELNGWKYEKTDDGGTMVGAVSSGAGGDAPALDQAEVAALRKEEIATALADLDCRMDYQKIHDQVQVELEKEFVAQHKAELERYRDAINGGR